MKNILLLIVLCLAFVGCSLFEKTPATPTSPAKPAPIIAPIVDAGCAIETAVTSGFATAVATALNCTNVAVVQSSLLTAFGNANLCTQQAAVTAAKAAKAGTAKPMGVIGNIACPMAVSAAMGFLTNEVPASWGCSTGASASVLSTTLIAACELAIPI